MRLSSGAVMREVDCKEIKWMFTQERRPVAKTRNFWDKYGQKSIDTATKTGIDAAKTASKRVVQKTAETTRDLIGNKIADKITSAGKSKNKGKEEDNEINKMQEIYIPPEKRKLIIDDLRSKI